MSLMYGYLGKLLRVDLTKGEIVSQTVDESILRKYIGGASLGIRLVYDEVPPGVDWQDPENRIFIGSGPLGATTIEGSGSVAAVTKGALTNGIASSQANGFFGAFLRLSGFDGIILHGASPKEVYLHVHDGTAEIRDAGHLIGKDTHTTEHIIKQELQRGRRSASVLCIGPAGENLVRFALVSTDMGHVASHNGIGAVMGSKKLKAIVVDRGKRIIPIRDKEALSHLAGEIRTRVHEIGIYDRFSKYGTVGGVYTNTKLGTCHVPVRNYTTTSYAIDPNSLEKYTVEYIRSMLGAKPNPCWACRTKHCHTGKIPEGKYGGREVEEPEFESMGCWSALVGVTEVSATIAIANEVDRLGMDTNEAGWVVAWLMECYEKQILSKADIDGIEMSWGNDDAIMAILHKIAKRDGIGDILAEGVMRASKRVGGDAAKLAIYAQKGNTPRTHDHRTEWMELFDTCVSNLGTVEAHRLAPYKILLGSLKTYGPFDPEAIPTVNAKIKGAMVFEDSLVTCRFRTGTQLDLLCQAINAATGWNMDVREAMLVGKRAVNLARVFNLRHGIHSELDAPSSRYGSTPSEGVAKGIGIMPYWDGMLRTYYDAMGWDDRGIPLPDTLKSLGLESIIRDL